MSDDPFQAAIDAEIADLDTDTLLLYIQYLQMRIQLYEQRIVELTRERNEARAIARLNHDTIMNRRDS